MVSEEKFPVCRLYNKGNFLGRNKQQNSIFFSKTRFVFVDNKMLFMQGCVETGQEFVKQHLWKIGGSAIGVALIQVRTS